jgi:hypothetical protein
MAQARKEKPKYTSPKTQAKRVARMKSNTEILNKLK